MSTSVVMRRRVPGGSERAGSAGGRQPNLEPGAPPELARHLDVTAEVLGDVLDDRDAEAGVGDREDHLAVVARELDLHLPTGGRVPDRVVHQVAYQQSQVPSRAADPRDGRGRD